MKKIRPSKHRENRAIKHLHMKPKTQFPSLKAQCLAKNTTEFVRLKMLRSIST